MSKGPKEQVTTNRLDSRAEEYRNSVYDRARGVGLEKYSSYQGPTVAGADPSSRAASAGMGDMARRFGLLGDAASQMQFGNGLPAERDFGGGGADPNRRFGNFDTNFDMNMQPYQGAGATGAAALGGDQAATNRLMNPYQSSVIDRLGGQYDRLRAGASRSADDAATKSGAFGGSRHAIVEGQRLGEIDRAQGDMTAQLLQGGFNDAMGRAGSAANLGLGAGGLSSSNMLGVGGLRLGAEQAGANYGLGAGDQRLRGQGMAADYALGAGAQRLQGQGMALDARGQALTAAQAQQGAYGQQFGMGDYYRQLAQQQMNNNQSQFNEERDWGARGLNIMSGPLGAPTGSTQSTPLHGNLFNDVLGAASLALPFVFPPAGAAAAAGALAR